MGTDEAREFVVDARVENLDAVNAFVDEILAPLGCSMKTRMQIDLVVEELFVNIASYAYGDGQGKATVRGRAQEEPPMVELVFIDEGTPYNPLDREDPDTSLSVEERGIGGLGIFLVKKNVDGIAYEHRDGKNILTIRKNLE